MTGPLLAALALVALAPLASAQDPWADPSSRAPGGAPPPGYAPAQKERRLELAAFAGYQLNSDVTTSAGTLQIDDAPGYGVALDWTLGAGQQVELLWVYSATDVSLRAIPGSPGSAPFPVDSHYFQLGGLYAVSRGKLEPFVSGSLGAALYVPGTIALDGGGTLSPAATWRFAFTLGGGVKIWLGDTIGLRLQARLLAPVLFSSGAFYSGPGGATLAVSGGIPFVQGDFTAGLVFAP